VAGRTYPLGLHGFARASDFDLDESAPDRAIFVLREGWPRPRGAPAAG
jgi:hypothetical protein